MFVSCTQAATLIAVYANISFANITGIGWGWAGVIWLYSLIFYVPLDIIKFVFHYALSGDAWNLVLDRKVGAFLSSALLLKTYTLFLERQRLLVSVLQTAFTCKKDDGKADVTISQRSHSAEELSGSRSRPSWIAEQTRRRAEIARFYTAFGFSLPFYIPPEPSLLHVQNLCFCSSDRLLEGHSVSRHLESVIKLKQIDTKTIRAAHTV